MDKLFMRYVSFELPVDLKTSYLILNWDVNFVPIYVNAAYYALILEKLIDFKSLKIWTFLTYTFLTLIFESILINKFLIGVDTLEVTFEKKNY